MRTMGTLKEVRMPDDREAVRLNLEYYRKAAKSLLTLRRLGTQQQPRAHALAARLGSSSGRWRIAIPYHRTCRPRLLPITAGAGRVGARHQRGKPYACKEDLEGLRLLLAAGAEPNHVNERGETSLHWAVWRGRSAAIIEALLDAGTGIDARRPDGRTAYAMAVQSGQVETANLLAGRGANTEVSVLDRFLGDCAAAGSAELERLLASSPEWKLPDEYPRLLPDLASSHCTAGVRALLAAGVPIRVESSVARHCIGPVGRDGPIW
jgi:hypothetical protein